MEAKYYAFEGHYLGMSKLKQVLKMPKWLYGFLKAQRKTDFVVVNAPSSGSFFAQLISRKRLIVYLGGVPEERKNTFKRRLLIDFPLKRALKRASLVWYNDDSAVEMYAKNYNRNSFLVSNSVDLELFHMELKQNRHFTIGIVGPFDAEYNLPGLEYVLGNLNRLPEGSQLKVIGSGPYRIRGDERVVFLGELKAGEYRTVLRNLDVLIVPRFKKTTCPQSKVLEAMASCIPVIQMDQSMPPRDSKNASSIFVVSKMDDMFMLLNLLSESPNLRRSIGFEARKAIEKNYSIEKAKEAMQVSFQSTKEYCPNPSLLKR